MPIAPKLLLIFMFVALGGPHSGCRLFEKNSILSDQDLTEKPLPGSSNEGIVPANLKDPIKAVWISLTDSNVLKNRRNIQAAVEKVCNRTALNTILPIVYSRGKIFFKSNTLSRKYPGLIHKELSNNNSRDILREFIDAAKACDRPLKVYPWVEYGLRIPDKITEVKNKHYMQITDSIRKNSPHWILPGTYARTKTFQHGFLDPRKPGVQNFLLQLCSEILANYPSISGLNIDDNFSIHKNTIVNEFLRARGFDIQTIEGVILPEEEHQHQDKAKASEVMEQVEVSSEDIELSNKAKLVRKQAEQFASEIRDSTTRLFAQIYDLHVPKLGQRFSPFKKVLFTPHEGVNFANREWLIDINSMIRGKNLDHFVLFPHAYRADEALDLNKYLSKFYNELKVWPKLTDRRPKIFQGVAVLSGTKARYTRTPELLATVDSLEKFGLGYAMFFYETMLGKYSNEERINSLKEVMSQ